jgi:hypothetical protein
VIDAFCCGLKSGHPQDVLRLLTKPAACGTNLPDTATSPLSATSIRACLELLLNGKGQNAAISSDGVTQYFFKIRMIEEIFLLILHYLISINFSKPKPG